MNSKPDRLARKKTRADEIAAFERKISETDTLKIIVHHLANGGHLFDLLDLWGCAYNDILTWIVKDDDRRNMYNSAMQTQNEFVKREVLDTLRKIARFDIRTLYDSEGALKHPLDWPAEAAFAVAGIETEELFEGRGKERALTGYAKKVKLRDNLKAFEMIGKNLALFVERHEHTHKHTLEALVMASIEPKAPLTIQAESERPIINLPPLKTDCPIERDTGFFDSSAQGIPPTFLPENSSNQEDKKAVEEKSESELSVFKAVDEKESPENFLKNSEEKVVEKITKTEKEKLLDDMRTDDLPI